MATSRLVAGQPEASKATVTSASVEFFEKNVRPVLVQHCQECHGVKKQEGDLRLDSRENLLKGGVRGSAITPGTPADSLLIKAIGYADEELQMPPDDQLPAESVAALTKWIRDGAVWPDDPDVPLSAPSADVAWQTHWAAQPIRSQAIPEVSHAEWLTSPIDNFILAKLEQNGISPPKQADRRTLLRRITFDLIGLPPTEDELADFEQDQSPDAYAKVVERLLASPHYGERWARHWLDVARYADTKEYVRLKEEPRYIYAYTYRDYVVQAFNDDLPFNRFIVEQLAADLLPSNANRSALAALGFLTLGRQFTGNPHDIIDDRIDVVTRGLLGLTVTCARCHDHKYDPISSADYYSLYGVFASTESPAVPPLIENVADNPRAKEHLKAANAHEAALNQFQANAHLRLVDELRANVAEYLVAALQGRQPYLVPLPANPGEVRTLVVERWLDYLDATKRQESRVFGPWHALAVIQEDKSFADRSHEVLAKLRDIGNGESSIRFNKIVLDKLERQPVRSMTDVARAYGAAFTDVYDHWKAEFEGHNHVVNGGFEQSTNEVNASPEGWTLSGSRFCTLANEGTSQGKLAAVFGNGTPKSRPVTAHSAALSQIVKLRPEVRYRLVFDFGAYGDARRKNAQTLRVTVNGQSQLAERTVSATGSVPTTFQAIEIEFVADAPEAEISFEDVTGNEIGLTDGVLDNVRLYELSPNGQVISEKVSSQLDADEAELLDVLIGKTSPTNVTWNDAVDFYLYESPIHDKIMELRKKLNDWLAKTDVAPCRVHVLTDREVPVDPCVFLRGDPTRRGSPVPRQFLAALAGSNRRPFSGGSGRLDLARAIANPDNPLTARVLVNRVWMHHFGAGLVKSPSNFGLRGDPPSHPELLDYLAERFIQDGWSIKQLHRLIVLSSTYCQRSDDRPEARTIDPENRLLWRMNRRRLDIESFRDAILATTGRLDLTVGGPSIDLASSNAMRRTLYGVIDRRNLDSMLSTFDFAAPEAHSASRFTTTVPQQSLFLLNGSFILAQAEALTERTELKTLEDCRQRVTRMYQLVLNRLPGKDELKSALSYIESGGTWPELAQAMCLSNEFSFVD